ncbi:putative mitochondrial protein (mitochondrion) [Arabidopsis thaliana]|uniref:Uncharacterized mitochondrial protein AtMg01100 n=4 Tax=Brassicaceae TaxID=3700 RepID=M1100_ARATH|nr:RecName: Full=Uncharacterized mitochondrial protein AtMg01100; AltName: Full=ORF105a [Arabidopsis thaliana]KAG7529240.1 hypothetical protein ISN45_Un97g000210 [Arabidopsis thaliana x Arabidopsis arenosa]KAG7529354.1 hypothetical protein ISN44_Un143g000450 [Arabidopsis suecica]BBB05395.1 ORF105C protein [Turritis glabra]CAA69795.1 unnamed protein product [Arabidopsis thaliana]
MQSPAMKRIKSSSHSRWDGSGSVNEMPFPSTIRLQGSFWECSTRRHMCYILRYLFRANGHRHFSYERLDCRNQTLRLPDHLYQPSRPHLLPHLSQLLLVRDSGYL